MAIVAGNSVYAFAASFFLHVVFEKPIDLVISAIEKKLTLYFTRETSEPVTTQSSVPQTRTKQRGKNSKRS